MGETLRRMMGRFWIVLLTCLALAVVVVASESEVKTKETQADIPLSDPLIQAFIRGLLSPNENEMFSGTEEVIRGKLNRLRTMAGSDADLIVQFLYFSFKARGTREAMLPAGLVEHFEISKTTIAAAVLPLLEAKDVAVREKAANWLAGTDEHLTGKGVDFSRYESILRKEQPSAPLGVIRYIFDRNPASALLVAARVYVDKESEAIVAAKLKHDVKLRQHANLEHREAAANLEHETAKSQQRAIAAKSKQGLRETWDYFLGRPEWWAHLYVAQAMRKHTELRDPERDVEILKQLAKDDHPLVREVVAEIASDRKN